MERCVSLHQWNSKLPVDNYITLCIKENRFQICQQEWTRDIITLCINGNRFQICQQKWTKDITTLCIKGYRLQICQQEWTRDNNHINSTPS